ncbi:TMEM175 family protein [Methanobrevibacter sp.]|uniref:TMEM175 family protein n=1 Tax=Methanobrevibacter sp. TaxID=66852 RepID=UPI00388DD042
MVHNIFNNYRQRMVAITDGVFAIAMTILVLEIAAPAVSEITSGAALNEYFITYLIPSILIYFLSFYIVYNFWENTVILYNFTKVSNDVLSLNVLTMATVCLTPFATGFLFNFYNYTLVNVFFSLLIMVTSLLYIVMFIILVRDNYSEYFKKKDEIKTVIDKKHDDGIELDNLRIYARGVVLTLFYLLLSPFITSIISLVLAFFSPLASIASFVLILILRFAIRMKRSTKDQLVNIELTDEERELVDNIRQSIYGED